MATDDVDSFDPSLKSGEELGPEPLGRVGRFDYCPDGSPFMLLLARVGIDLDSGVLPRLKSATKTSKGHRCAVLLFDARFFWCTSWAIGLALPVIISRCTVEDDRQFLHEGSLRSQT